MEASQKNPGFIVSLLVPIFVAALYYLLRLDANNARIFEAVLLLAGMYLGLALFLLDATELYKHYSKINRVPGLGSANSGGESTQIMPENVNADASEAFQAQVPSAEHSTTAEPEHVHPSHLITRSLLFVLSLVPLGIFLLTSTGSVLGIGLYLGILVSYSSELVSFYHSPQLIRDRFLYQLKKAPQANEMLWFMVGVVTWTVLFGVLVVW